MTPKSIYRPRQPQYRLRQEAIDGITPVFNSLLDAGLIVPCPDSPCSTPIFPVKKAPVAGQSVTWRFVQDLKKVNDAVHPRTPIVPDPHTLLTQVPGGSEWFSVVDLANAFFLAYRWIQQANIGLLFDLMVNHIRGLGCHKGIVNHRPFSLQRCTTI